MLVIGYMTENGMNWHNDGEGLDNTIVSLSLGGEATIGFRMKAEYHIPKALLPKNIARNNPTRKVVVGSKHWAERVALNDSNGNVDEWEAAKGSIQRLQRCQGKILPGSIDSAEAR